jgi:hypothetical protein
MRTKILLILLLILLSSVVHAQVDQEANQQAKNFWNSRITKCGDDYYTKDRSYVHQFRNPRIEVKARQLSSADRLNGIEYIGSTSYKTELSRTYSPNGTRFQSEKGWGKWENGLTASMGGIGLDAALRKENGRWSVIPDSWSQAVVLKPIDCSNILGSSDNENKDSLLNNLPSTLDFKDSGVLATLKKYGLIMVCNPNPSYTQEQPKSIPKSRDGVDVRTEKILPLVNTSNPCETGKPNPLSLVVEVASNGNLSLNNEKQGSILAQTILLGTLNKIFKDRKENGVYREGTNDIENTVTIKVPSKINKDVFVKTLKLITSSGSSPITLYIAK